MGNAGPQPAKGHACGPGMTMPWPVQYRYTGSACVCVCVCCPQTDKSTLKYKKKAMYVLKLAAVKLDNNSIKKLVGAAGRVQG